MVQQELHGRGAFDNIAEYTRLQENYDKEALDAYMAWTSDSDLGHFEDCYCGKWDDEEAYAENFVAECYDLRAMGDLARNFDYKAFARELFMYDYYFDDGYVLRPW